MIINTHLFNLIFILNDGCRSSNSSLGDVVQTRVYLKDFAHYAEMNEIYGNYFTDEVGKPARTSCQVGALAHGAQIEIEAVAALKSRCCVFVVNKLKI